MAHKPFWGLPALAEGGLLLQADMAAEPQGAFGQMCPPDGHSCPAHSCSRGAVAERAVAQLHQALDDQQSLLESALGRAGRAEKEAAEQWQAAEASARRAQLSAVHQAHAEQAAQDAAAQVEGLTANVRALTSRLAAVEQQLKQAEGKAASAAKEVQQARELAHAAQRQLRQQQAMMGMCSWWGAPGWGTAPGWPPIGQPPPPPPRPPPQRGQPPPPQQQQQSLRPHLQREACRHVWVGGLHAFPSQEWGSWLLQQEFRPFGPIESVMVVGRHPQHPARGYGIVSFSTRSSAVAAVQALDGRVVPRLAGSTPLMLRFIQNTGTPRAGPAAGQAQPFVPPPPGGLGQGMRHASSDSALPRPSPPPPPPPPPRSALPSSEPHLPLLPGAQEVEEPEQAARAADLPSPRAHLAAGNGDGQQHNGGCSLEVECVPTPPQSAAAAALARAARLPEAHELHAVEEGAEEEEEVVGRLEGGGDSHKPCTLATQPWGGLGESAGWGQMSDLAAGLSCSPQQRPSAELELSSEVGMSMAQDEGGEGGLQFCWKGEKDQSEETPTP